MPHTTLALQSPTRLAALIDAPPSVTLPSTPSLAQDEPPQELLLTARGKITLQCGLASITLHPNGKIVIHGQHILSAAEGVNRIAGGQIDIN